MKKKLLAESPYKTVSFVILSLFVLYYYRQKQSYAEKTTSNVLHVQEVAQKTNDHPIQEVSNTPRLAPISITNTITKQMLTYKHWSGSYTPSIFAITVAGNQLLNNETIQVQATTQNTITIRYDYSFANGYKTGSREIEFIISPEKTQYALTFSWSTPTHLILENAAIKEATVVAFNKSLESKKS